MLSASSALLDTLKKSTSIKATPRVIAEWNHNRYQPITTVDNWNWPEKDKGYDLTAFPIKSITQPIRPTNGVAFAKIGEAKLQDGYSADSPTTTRYHTINDNSKYKYWTSPNQTDATKDTAGNYGVIEPVQPYIIYSAPVWTNKIYVCFETSWAKPAHWMIQYTIDGKNWLGSPTAVDLSPNADGVVAVWRQADGSWSTTKNYSNPIQIRGVRIVVYSMNRAGSYCNVIELGARLEQDLTSYLVSYSVSNEMSDHDFVTPMGTVSSNTGSLVLNNYDGRFNNYNPGSIYNGIIDSNVKFTIDIGFDTTSYGGSGYEYIRQATMYADGPWGGSDESVTVTLKDPSKYLQEMKPLSLLMQSVTVGQAIWRLLDSVGFSDYLYIKSADDAPTHIPYFWTDPTKSVWDHIQELCRTTQSGAYFDEYGILKILTRNAAYDKSKTVAWNLDWVVNGTKQPEIIGLDVTNSLEANTVTITWTPTGTSTDEIGRPISEIIWEPTSTIVLRSTALGSPMTATQKYIRIDQKDASSWPCAGMMNVRGELIKYDGKQYTYIDKKGKWQKIYINSADEQRMVDNTLTQSGQSWRSYYTGYFYVKERGYDTTVPQAHSLNVDDWKNRAYYGTGTSMKHWSGGVYQNRADGVMRLRTNKTFKNQHWYVAGRGIITHSTPNYYFGTRMRFTSAGAGTARNAGLFFHASSDMKTMYTVEVMTTKSISAGTRKFRNEIAIIRRSGGTYKYLGKGAVASITDNKWFDLEVQKKDSVISVSLNGMEVLNVTDPAKDITSSARQGLFVRGYTCAEFEAYYYASATPRVENESDQNDYSDIFKTGTYSNQFYKDWTYGYTYTKKKIGKKTTKVKNYYGQRLIDDFGITVHEVRPFNVTFDKPVLYSDLYSSNSQIVNVEYTHSPFGAEFIVANSARVNAIGSGEDTLTYGPDNSISQRMLITGQTVMQKEAKVYKVAANSDALNTRGEVALDIQSQWIQTESAAKALGDWIIKNWSDPADEVEVEVFGNPLYQIGDLVTVNYGPKDMTPTTHKYFIVNCDQSWDTGLTTKLTLRRARGI